MANAVFITRVQPEYDDLPEERYHFPSTYLNKAQETVRDWILYYEPRRDGGRQAYFATAQVLTVEKDTQRGDHYYAYVRNYIEFPSPVPFRIGDQYFESALRRPDGSVNLGLFQRAIHHLPLREYMAIVQEGMRGVAEAPTNKDDEGADLRETGSEFGRLRIETIVTRPVRDQAFRKIVREVYESTCAVTGLRLENGEGRFEIEAAHIRPVADDGPDSPRNGIALSRTCHWLLDRGLMSFEDDGVILLARKLVSDEIRRLVNPEGCIRLPEKPSMRPHPRFLRFHRERKFQG